MTAMGFHMMMQHEPALICVVLGPWDHTFSAPQESGECVIAVPTIDLAQTVVDVGNCSGEQLDKFETFGLTTMPSRHVRAPSIMECIANDRNKPTNGRTRQRLRGHLLAGRTQPDGGRLGSIRRPRVFVKRVQRSAFHIFKMSRRTRTTTCFRTGDFVHRIPFGISVQFHHARCRN